MGGGAKGDCLKTWSRQPHRTENISSVKQKIVETSVLGFDAFFDELYLPFCYCWNMQMFIATVNQEINKYIFYAKKSRSLIFWMFSPQICIL